jgi:staphylococcal nuclease domain-containing protein 1
MSVVIQFAFQVSEYREAQETAKKSHANVWMYGDITEDDAKEFGLGR